MNILKLRSVGSSVVHRKIGVEIQNVQYFMPEIVAEVGERALVGRQLEVGLVEVNHDLDGIVEEVANDEEASDEVVAAAAVVGAVVAVVVVVAVDEAVVVAAVDDGAVSSFLHDAVAAVAVVDAAVVAAVAARDVAAAYFEDAVDAEDAFAFATAFVDASAWDLDGLASSFEHSGVVVAASVDVEEPFVEDVVEAAFLA